MYDLELPRISISNELGDSGCELGQDGVWGEAMFFLSIGYSVSVARWDPKQGIFVNECNYYPGDL